MVLNTNTTHYATHLTLHTPYHPHMQNTPHTLHRHTTPIITFNYTTVITQHTVHRYRN